MNRMNTADTAWVAGLLEGEGCFTVAKKHGSRTSPRVMVNMTDEDVIRSLSEKTGIGSVYGPYDKSETNLGSKPFWTWSVQAYDEVENLVYALLPFLHERRSLAAINVLNAVEERKLAAAHRRAFYKCGHERTRENTYHGRNCKTCADNYQANKIKVKK